MVLPIPKNIRQQEGGMFPGFENGDQSREISKKFHLEGRKKIAEKRGQTCRGDGRAS